MLRHGQTVFNTQDIVQGWNDSPLTELGLYQPKCTGYGLKDLKFEKLYSGDCVRQIDTAKQFISQNNHPLEIIPDMHFREMCYGKFQAGTYYDMLNPLYQMHNAVYEGYFGLYKFMDDYTIANEIYKRDETKQAEGPERAWTRFKEGLDMITKENDNCNVLISTSSAVIAITLKKLFPDFIQSGLVDNASMTVITYENGNYSLEEYNNIKYRKLGEEYFESKTILANDKILKIHGTSSDVTFVCGALTVIGSGEFKTKSEKIDGFILYSASLKYEDGKPLIIEERTKLKKLYLEFAKDKKDADWEIDWDI